MTNQKKYDAPLLTLMSCRVRLTDAQREMYKKAYNDVRAGRQPKEQPALAVGSSISVSTAIDTMSDFHQRVGMNDIVIADILGTRDSVSLTILLKLQEELGIKAISKKQILDCAKSYTEYCWSEYNPSY